MGQIQRMAFLATLNVFLGCSDMGEPVDPSGGRGTDGVEHRVVRAYAYTAYDTNGTVLVTGTIRLAIGESGTITGTWDLAAAPGVPPEGLGPQLGKGSLVGTLEGSVIGLNLNPPFVDNNVLLTGTMSSNRIDGRWDHVGFPGVMRRGTFIALMQPTVLHEAFRGRPEGWLLLDSPFRRAPYQQWKKGGCQA